jgi:hypothetical protein
MINYHGIILAKSCHMLFSLRSTIMAGTGSSSEFNGYNYGLKGGIAIYGIADV